LFLLVGCSRFEQTIYKATMLYKPPPPPAPLGALIDPVFQTQELNAEASDFIVYQHEFKMGLTELNPSGQDHLQEIAYRLQHGMNLPVVVERSDMGIDPDTEFQYPVNPDPEIDMKRRAVVVKALSHMGVGDADQRVVVALAYAPGEPASESAAAFQRGFGGFFGGFGGSSIGGLGFGGFRTFGGFFGF
jgi:hypothetical protein